MISVHVARDTAPTGTVVEERDHELVFKLDTTIITYMPRRRAWVAMEGERTAYTSSQYNGLGWEERAHNHIRGYLRGLRHGATGPQMSKLLHALGGSASGMGARLGWRRHYAASIQDVGDCDALVALGYMRKGANNRVYLVTEAAAAIFGVEVITS